MRSLLFFVLGAVYVGGWYASAKSAIAGAVLLSWVSRDRSERCHWRSVASYHSAGWDCRSDDRKSRYLW